MNIKDYAEQRQKLMDEARAAEAEALFPALLEKYDAVCAASARRGELYKAKERR